jgi:hypothetical protein
MAAITITEILGGDNIAGSRLTINDNFKKVANAINTIETYVNTSPVGGQISIGNVLIQRGSNPDTTTLFTCTASGVVSGNFNIGKDLGVTQNLSVTQDLTANRGVNFSGSTGSFVSSVPSSFNNQFGSSQFYAATTSAPVIDPQTLTPAGAASRNISSVTGHRVLRLDLSTYTGATTFNCNTISLPSITTVNYGQILTIIIDQKSSVALTTFAISNSTFAPGYSANAVTFSNLDNDGVNKQSVTLFADVKGWRVLSATGVTVA